MPNGLWPPPQHYSEQVQNNWRCSVFNPPFSRVLAVPNPFTVTRFLLYCIFQNVLLLEWLSLYVSCLARILLWNNLFVCCEYVLFSLVNKELTVQQRGRKMFYLETRWGHSIEELRITRRHGKKEDEHAMLTKNTAMWWNIHKKYGISCKN